MGRPSCESVSAADQAYNAYRAGGGVERFSNIATAGG
jgi:hypothetical protein